LPIQCRPNFGGKEVKIITAILERPVIAKILSHLGRNAARRADQTPVAHLAVATASVAGWLAVETAIRSPYARNKK
jgi:hypothetical protein